MQFISWFSLIEFGRTAAIGRLADSYRQPGVCYEAQSLPSLTQRDAAQQQVSDERIHYKKISGGGSSASANNTVPFLLTWLPVCFDCLKTDKDNGRSGRNSINRSSTIKRQPAECLYVDYRAVSTAGGHCWLCFDNEFTTSAIDAAKCFLLFVPFGVLRPIFFVCVQF